MLIEHQPIRNITSSVDNEVIFTNVLPVVSSSDGLFGLVAVRIIPRQVREIVSEKIGVVDGVFVAVIQDSVRVSDAHSTFPFQGFV